MVLGLEPGLDKIVGIKIALHAHNKEIYRRATQWCNVPPFFLCKNYAVSCQKAEQPASTACLLAVLLIITCIYLAGVMADSMRNAICAATRFQREWPFCFYPYSVLHDCANVSYTKNPEWIKLGLG